MIQSSPIEYMLLSETMVDEDVAMRRRKVINENAISVNGVNLFTVTYEQILQDFGVRNWNGRIYQMEGTMKAIQNNPLIQHDLSKGTWTAEYGHPDLGSAKNELARQMTIDPKNACNTINKIWTEGNYLIGECTTLAGSWGDVLRDRILTNYPAMASSRAVGGVDKNGNVLDGYTLVTYDTVIRPSHKTAYQKGDRNSVNINNFRVGTGNTMSECAMKIDYKSDAFKDFLLTESVSRDRIDRVCDTFGIDYSSMTIQGNNVYLTRINENAVETVVLPINKLVNANYYNLF